MHAETITIYLTHPEPVRSAYQKEIESRHPECVVRTVTTLDALESAVTDTDILVVYGGNLGAHPGIFRRAPRLRWVHALTTGVDGIIDNPSLPQEVIVSATRGLHGPSVAELCFLLMIGLLRDVRRILNNQQERTWARWPGGLLHGKTVGILGVGSIAADLAPRCKAFGMKVVGISRSPRPLEGFDEMRARENLPEAVRDLDFLVLLIPLSEDTRNIVDATIINAMKSTAYLINIARGGVLDEVALIEALEAKRIAGAGVDTFAQEPLLPQHPLWRAPNLLITAHLGGFSDTYVDLAVGAFETNLTHFRNNEHNRMTHLVSREGQ